MNIFGILTMIGGLAMFLYGMSVMGGGLEKMSGGKLERILEIVIFKTILWKNTADRFAGEDRLAAGMKPLF